MGSWGMLSDLCFADLLLFVPVIGGDGSSVGGLVALNSGIITQSYATGPTTGGTNSDVAGLVAQNSGLIDQTYAVGFVSAGAGCTPASTTVTCSIGALPAGGNSNVSITAKVQSAGPPLCDTVKFPLLTATRQRSVCPLRRRSKRKLPFAFSSNGS